MFRLTLPNADYACTYSKGHTRLTLANADRVHQRSSFIHNRLVLASPRPVYFRRLYHTSVYSYRHRQSYPWLSGIRKRPLVIDDSISLSPLL